MKSLFCPLTKSLHHLLSPLTSHSPNLTFFHGKNNSLCAKQHRTALHHQVPNNAHRTTDFQFCAWHGLIEAHGECDGVVIMMLESLAYIDYLGFSFMYSVVQCKIFGLPSSHFFFGL